MQHTDPAGPRFLSGLRAAATALGLAAATLCHAWEPTQPVEIVVPAGTGGGADQMARFVQEVVAKHGLMRQPIKVVNMAGNSGADGLLAVREAKGNPHKLIITLSSLFTVPLATGVQFNWRELTPVSMMALDQFVLWVNAQSAYKTPQALLSALRERPPGSFKLGGTGSKQEDQLISVLLETAAATRIQYVPLKGGGDVAKALAAGEVDLTVNNPIEAEALWRSGKLRPLCVFDGARLDYPAKLSNGQSWNEIPTCMSAGIPAQYLMLRGFFMAAKNTPEQQAFYVQLLERVRALPEWRELMAKGAFRQTAMTGPSYTEWLDRNESYHRVLMREAKLIARP
ncbi:MAG: tripartite tricarboxylate transporter substrate binding protein [Burkholderiales bacterium]|nr:tripartite tricarboxylate transporter substrate binding protein [Burkholderiales bacterium]